MSVLFRVRLSDFHWDFYYHFHLSEAKHNYICVTGETNHKVAPVTFWGKQILILDVLILWPIKNTPIATYNTCLHWFDIIWNPVDFPSGIPETKPLNKWPEKTLNLDLKWSWILLLVHFTHLSSKLYSSELLQPDPTPHWHFQSWPWYYVCEHSQSWCCRVQPGLCFIRNPYLSYEALLKTQSAKE